MDTTGKNITLRHQYIIRRIKEEGYVSVTDLSESLNISSVTIRKDLKFLESKKLLFRSHGGAMLQNPYAIDMHVNVKEKIRIEAKTEIAIAAQEFIKPNDSIIISSGTTTLQFGRSISIKEKLTVITPSINISMELINKPNIEVIQLGGILRQSSKSATGSYSEGMLENFTCSKLFLGVDGIDYDYGISAGNILEANLNKSMIKSADKIIVLADATKFGKRGFGKICNLEDVDQIITDSGISAYILNKLESKGIEVTIAPKK